MLFRSIGGKERADVLAEVDAIIEYHRKLKAAHHERMRRRLVKGEQSEADADAAFVSGVMQNLKIGGVLGDVQDVSAEDSDEDARDDSEDDESDEDEFVEAPMSATSESKPLPPIPGGLERIPDGKARGRKRDRVPIDPPKLTLIPALVPVFVELVRGELHAARRVARASQPVPQR